jgi:hypothetical protein
MDNVQNGDSCIFKKLVNTYVVLQVKRPSLLSDLTKTVKCWQVLIVNLPHNQPQSHFVQHKSHMTCPELEPGP